jgi:hypothetical protein
MQPRPIVRVVFVLAGCCAALGFYPGLGWPFLGITLIVGLLRLRNGDRAQGIGFIVCACTSVCLQGLLFLYVYCYNPTFFQK